MNKFGFDIPDKLKNFFLNRYMIFRLKVSWGQKSVFPNKFNSSNSNNGNK